MTCRRTGEPVLVGGLLVQGPAGASTTPATRGVVSIRKRLRLGGRRGPLHTRSLLRYDPGMKERQRAIRTRPRLEARQ
jgi:hypothetical protein